MVAGEPPPLEGELVAAPKRSDMLRGHVAAQRA